ncbi:anti-sigma factor [Lysobacter korlensis]|uniref:Anti-sigma factor n=1 Tax=Lysobacter korlensis TaxID=553636 RepID=A0ABV6S228_9GAMM
MPHVDPDVLALLALGEPVASEAEERHVAECSDCTGALDTLRATAAVGRAARSAEPLLTPPARVWDGIAAQLGLADDVRPETADLRFGSSPAGDPPAPATPADEASPPAPVPIAERRGRRRLPAAAWLAAAAALVAIVIGIPAVLSVLRQPEPTVLAEATLEAFPAWPDARGAAVLEELPDGTRRVEVSLDAAVGDDGFREVWLIRDDASDLVSLGVLEGSEGTFTVPAGVDVEEFSLVDVSEEPRDGDPAHSGDSIVRGPLT